MNRKYSFTGIISGALLLFPALTNGQAYNNYFNGVNMYPDNSSAIIYPYCDTALAKQRIKEMSKVTYIKEKSLKLNDSVTYTYNEDGIQNETTVFMFLNKLKLVYSYSCIYDDLKRPVSSKYFNYHNSLNRTFNYQTWTYHDSLRTPDIVVRTGGKNNKTKFTYYTLYNYDRQNKIIAANGIKNNNLKKATHMKYERLPDGSLETIKVYDARNKLIYTYNYNCDKKGALITTPKKELQNACLVKNKLPNGHSQTVEVIENELGIKRTIREFDTTDRLINIFVYSGKTGATLVQADSFLYYGNDSSKSIHTYYNYKGQKLRMVNQFVYLRNNSNKILYKTFTRLNKTKVVIRENTIYKYNETGLLKSSDIHDTLNGKHRIELFSYKSY